MASFGKLGVVLLAREALLFRGRDQLAVDEQRRGGVVVETGDSENIHASRDSSLRRS